MTTPLGLKEAIEYVLEPILRLDPFPDDDAELMDLFRYTPVEVEGEALVNLFIACSKYLPMLSDPESEPEDTLLQPIKTVRVRLNKIAGLGPLPSDTTEIEDTTP